MSRATAQDSKEYLSLIKKTFPKTKHAPLLIRAILVGGLLCCLSEFMKDVYGKIIPSFSEQDIGALTTMTFIFLTVTLTGFGVYDKIGEFGGAGSIIPITGFANSVASASLEKKREGVIFGICSNMFALAGPIIVLGIVASVIVGLITLILM